MWFHDHFCVRASDVNFIGSRRSQEERFTAPTAQPFRELGDASGPLSRYINIDKYVGYRTICLLQAETPLGSPELVHRLHSSRGNVLQRSLVAWYPINMLSMIFISVGHLSWLFYVGIFAIGQSAVCSAGVPMG